MKRTFLQRAQTYRPSDDIGGWWWSEKLDGQRCLWDGGVTRGLLKGDVPWAVTSKDGRFKESPVATGLWSLGGHVIHAPDWWIEKLPKGVLLDGELYTPGLRQDLRSAISCSSAAGAANDFSAVTYYVFDAPSATTIFANGNVDFGRGNTKYFSAIPNWLSDRGFVVTKPMRICDAYDYLNRILPPASSSTVPAATCVVLPQYVLPFPFDLAHETATAFMTKIYEAGGEGIMIRDPNAVYSCCRTHSLLKLKGWLDDEGIVVGYTSGKGKYLGMLGALVVSWHGRTFELSGMTDQERAEADRCFPIGSLVTFKYLQLTRDGLPENARYWRKRDAAD